MVECVTISHPHSIGRQLIGVANVLSTIKGTPCSCALLAHASISNTIRAGLAIVSPNTHFVFGLKAASSYSMEQSGERKVKSIPILRIVTLNKLYVPP